MIVSTSNLAIRFYVRDEWTEESLRPLISSSVTDPPFILKDPDEPRLSYWLPEVGTIMDIKKLMKVVTKVERGFNDYPHETDEEHLINHNW